MPILKCECGHPQVLHMGPTGPCRVTPMAPTAAGDRLQPDLGTERCDCTAFKLVAPELQRQDLQ